MDLEIFIWMTLTFSFKISSDFSSSGQQPPQKGKQGTGRAFSSTAPSPIKTPNKDYPKHGEKSIKRVRKEAL